uniref:Uncharacterized protein n=2 Tax=Cucumis melo TaxID=3656 RepID=A0A9I9EDA8_CUCME
VSFFISSSRRLTLQVQTQSTIPHPNAQIISPFPPQMAVAIVAIGDSIDRLLHRLYWPIRCLSRSPSRTDLSFFLSRSPSAAHPTRSPSAACPTPKMIIEFHGNIQNGKLYLKLRSNDGFDEMTYGITYRLLLGILKLNQMDSTDMELECDGSCETSKIVRDEDTDGKRKTIDVDLDSYGREDVPNPLKIRKNVKQSMVWDHFERLKGDPNDPRAKCKYC